MLDWIKSFAQTKEAEKVNSLQKIKDMIREVVIAEGEINEEQRKSFNEMLYDIVKISIRKSYG